MRKPIEIRYLSTAQKDLIEIFEYIRKDNPAAAASELDKFEPLAKLLNQEEIVIPGNPGEGRGRPGIQSRSERD